MVYAITDANGLPIMVYAIADANECLVITGSGIEDVKITKKTWVWPFQRYSRISVLPTDYSSKPEAQNVVLRTGV
jgi:flotillin